MRTLSVLGLTILSLAPLSSFAQSADPEPSQAPGANDPPPPVEVPPPVAAEPAPPPPPAPSPPPTTSGLPPINITITNTNTNTNPVTTTNTNTNPHTNTNTNTTTATATATVAPPPSVAAAPIALSPRPGVVERYTLSAPTRSARWITLGAIAGDHALGARGSIDLITRGAWALGIAGSITGDGGHGGGGRDHGERAGPERGGGRGTATMYLARTGSILGFDVRAQLGAGVAFGDAHGRSGSAEIARTTTGDPTPQDDDRRGARRAAPIAQAALLVGRSLSAHWGIAAGPVLTALGTSTPSEDAHAAPVDVTLFAGLRYRL